MKHSIHSKETEQPYILNFLTYGGAIRRGGPKPTIVHDCPKRIAITLSAAWPTAGPRAETAYTAPPFFRPPFRRAAAIPHARKKKADTNRVAKSRQRRWHLTVKPFSPATCPFFFTPLLDGPHSSLSSLLPPSPSIYEPIFFGFILLFL